MRRTLGRTQMEARMNQEQTTLLVLYLLSLSYLYLVLG
jgi:hypothetical protein